MKEIKKYVEQEKEKIKKLVKDKKLSIVIITVGEDEVSKIYVKGKLNDAKELGIKAVNKRFKDKITQVELIREIRKLNQDKNVNGIIVQLPLPKHIDENVIGCAIHPTKDLDGFSPLSNINPCTPQGIINYLKDNKIELEGKRALVIGRSKIVGKPMADTFLKNNCTVAIAHSKTKERDLKNLIYWADIIVCAVGKPNFLTKDYKYQKHCIIMDVGINRKGKTIVGDVSNDLDIKYKSPVPSGVGLLTRLAIFQNLITLNNLK